MGRVSVVFTWGLYLLFLLVAFICCFSFDFVSVDFICCGGEGEGGGGRKKKEEDDIF